jgi:hypothetical protein
MKLIFNVGFIFIIKRINMYKMVYDEDAPNAIEMWETWFNCDNFDRDYFNLNRNIFNSRLKNLSNGKQRKFLIESYDV